MEKLWKSHGKSVLKKSSHPDLKKSWTDRNRCTVRMALCWIQCELVGLLVLSCVASTGLLDCERYTRFSCYVMHR